MSRQSYELKAELRDRVGKGAARALRTKGMIPAIVYGEKQDPLPVAVSAKELTTRLHAGGFLTTLATLEVGGKKHKVLPKAYELDPVRDFVTHVDFLRVTDASRVRVHVPVHFVGHDQSPGLKRGGVLNIVRHDIEVYCPAGLIPEFIEANLAGYEIGGSIHISKVKLPDNCKPVIDDRDFTIATIAGSLAMKPEEEDKPVVAAGEVPATAQKAPEGEAAAAGAKDAKGAAGAKDAKGAAGAAAPAAKDAKAAGKGDKK
jgi:large subunit ribosomal protein L25